MAERSTDAMFRSRLGGGNRRRGSLWMGLNSENKTSLLLMGRRTVFGTCPNRGFPLM
jgi:hypothetical protein